MNGPVLARTVNGTVRGRAHRGGWLFAGVPYAAAPTGARRFLPPAPAESWEGVRDAVEAGPSSPQRIVGALPHWRRLVELHARTSEDCLFLNVHTPSIDGAHRPVMVWFHGGGLQGGSGDGWPFLEGGFLDEDIVLVTVNYRLNVLGFLFLDDHFDEAQGTGNLGHLDQIAALRWVGENIASFGGDPQNVTIFGESAGGWSVAHLLAMPSARELFRSAIVQSGGLEAAATREEAAEITGSVLSSLGIADGDWDALQALPIERLLDETEPGRHPRTAVQLGSFLTVADGVVVALDPTARIASGSAAGKSVIVGHNRDEWAGMHLGVPAGVLPAPSYARAAARADVDEHVMRDHYRGSTVGSGRGDATAMEHAAFTTDSIFAVPAANLSEALVAGGARVWRYRFDWRSPVQDGVLGAYHAIDVPFTFDALDEPDMFGDAPPYEIAIGMRAAWVALARSADPTAFLDLSWPQFSAQRAVMSLRPDPVLLADPDRELHGPWGAAIRFRHPVPALTKE